MKIFKSLILGSAAGMLAVAGAQAADLPVKAKPVQYVKVCSAYGAGFYYIPGTDICLRVGGYIYSEFAVNDRSHSNQTGAAAKNRLDDATSWRVRQNLIIDARTNTEYGTLRSYFSGGLQWDTTSAGTPANQNGTSNLATTPLNSTWYYSAAFIQFAGFTFGLANSFFDFDGSKLYSAPNGQDAPKFAPMIAYTAQLGSGISATLSVEEATLRRNAIQVGGVTAGTVAAPTTLVLLGGQTFGPGGLNTAYAAHNMPDIVANLRVDQAWGDAQVSGVLHQVQTSTQVAPSQIVGAGEKWGYGFLGGLNFKLPQMGAGDNFQISGVWAKGCTACTNATGSNYNMTGRTISYRNGLNNFPNLTLMDAYIPLGGGASGPVSLNLTKTYSIDAEYRHFWTANLRSSIGWIRYHQDSPTAANIDGFTDGTLDSAMVNLIWSPVKNLDLGTEVYWSRLKTKNGNTAAGNTAVSNTAANPANGNNDWWGGVFKATRYW